MSRLTILEASKRLRLPVRKIIREVYFGSLVARRGRADGLAKTLYFTEQDLRAWKRGRA